MRIIIKEEETFHPDILDFYEKMFPNCTKDEINFNFSKEIKKVLYCNKYGNKLAVKHLDGSTEYYLDGVTYSEKSMLRLLKLKAFI